MSPEFLYAADPFVEISSLVEGTYGGSLVEWSHLRILRVAHPHISLVFFFLWILNTGQFLNAQNSVYITKYLLCLD